MPPVSCTNPPSAAKLFVQLCARRTASSYAATPSSSAILDVLLPPRIRARPLHVSASHYKPLTRVNTAPLSSRAAIAANAQRRHAVVGCQRAFTTSRSLAKTLAIRNPQTDEDGNEMLLEITPRAANRLSQIMSKDKNPYLALRIQVESGGCHGFQYIMSLTTLPASTSNPPLAAEQVADDVTPSTTTSDTPSPPALNEDDTIFAFTADADAADSSSSATLLTSPKIVLDLPSLELLKGSKVDYTMELIGSQFKIVDNPLATSSCGCGTSFDIKI